MAAVTNMKIGSGNSMLWAANNAQPLQVSSTCRLFLSPHGDLLLQYDSNKTAWQTHTADMGVSNLTLHDSGNLVLHTEQGLIVWQSFTQSPALAWNSGMNLTSNFTIYSAGLVPGAALFNVPGNLALQLHNHSTLVLFINPNDSSSSFVYWSTSFTNSSPFQRLHADTEQVSYVAFTDDGSFTFYDNSSQALGSIPPSNSTSALRVATLDPKSANLEAFYRTDVKWTLFYNSSITACENPTHCGKFGLCNATTLACTCPPGFLLQTSAGDCEPGMDIFSPLPSCSTSTAVDPSSYTFVSVNVSFPPQLFPISSPSVHNCTSLCIDNCTCRVALFDAGTSSCSLFSNLPTLTLSAESKQLMLLKLIKERHSPKKRLAAILGAVCAATAASLCLICAIAGIWSIKTRRPGNRNSRPTGPLLEDFFLQAIPRLPPRHTYKELEEATKKFSTRLGAGGFGAVYEGVLLSGVKVAVKKLEASTGQSSVQFRAEVASIGSISHVNLVTLKGFCQEGDQRLLVYEHMERGSLDRWLFRGGEEEGEQLGWLRRFKIALDTAMGLAYLHRECGERIVHCDVKPENILLDADFNAKVGDFGLAKLVGHGRQGFSLTTVKGTRGYLAPEWLQDATITSKSDVYSFGIVLLELISGRRCLDSDYGYLPTLAFRIVSSILAHSNRLQQSHLEKMMPTSAPLGFPVVGSGKESSLSHSLTSHERSIGRNILMQRSDVSQQELTPLAHPHNASVASSFSSSQHNDDNVFDMAALLDPRLSTDADVSATSLERMTFIALWCVQPNPAARPSMSKVVQMMEGIADVPPPPYVPPPPLLTLSYDVACSSSTSSLFTASR